ncbi:extensin family protein [Devosia pacifica]|uniref:Extensin family protein n=1 Tax=Devosia pacifica TaxID=1335967 RepID=A0A918S4P4_9HYPH|nr:extensin family protein [Devosia pacifica]GHA21219.1 extensin family protein [Devosia pacifica]
MRITPILAALALSVSPHIAAAQSLPRAFEDMVNAVGAGIEDLGDELAGPRAQERRAPSARIAPAPRAVSEEDVPLPAPRPENRAALAQVADEDLPDEQSSDADDDTDESTGATSPVADDTATMTEDDEVSPQNDSSEESVTDDGDALTEEETPLPRQRPAEAPIEPRAVDSDHEDVAESDRIYQSSCPAVLSGLVTAEALPPIAEGRCVERSPLSVTAVEANGRTIALSSPATLNCEMATALPKWLEAVDGYAKSRENARLETLVIGTSQFCRPRNNIAGSDLSEHGFANALDVTGFQLSDGRTVSLPGDWTPARSAEGRLLRFAHGAACTNFTTVLGPEANALHKDHFHVDLGCHGSTCTAQICE